MSGRLVVAVAAALVAVAVAVLVPYLLSDREAGLMGDVGRDRPTGDLAAVEVFEDLSRTHLPGEIDYDTAPPAGGEHADRWIECGTYDRPIRQENAVHSLEHGTVWITHDPDLPAEDLAALEEQLPEFGILSPYQGLPSPVVVTVWGRQLALEGADDPRLELFVDEYGDGATAPEVGVGCFGGIVEYDESGDAV